MSQCARILEVLKDGAPHSVSEIHARAGNSRLNSRITDLRKKGYQIKCETRPAEASSERYTYQLVNEPLAGEAGAASTAAAEPRDSRGVSRAEASHTSMPRLIDQPVQLSLVAPGAYDEAA